MSQDNVELVGQWMEEFDVSFHTHELRDVGDVVVALVEMAAQVEALACLSECRSASSMPTSVTA